MDSSQLTPEALMVGAVTACSSARALLELGDAVGSINRAYYAMFYAARAALLASNAPVDLDKIRTHNGLVGAFGNYLVKDGPLPKDLGRFINKALEDRLFSDYEDLNSIQPSDAMGTVEHAETFVAAIRTQFMP
jgi:uncharacterized protein (UPF0332 family)